MVAATQVLKHSIPLANDPNLSGPAFTIQALTGGLRQGWQFSNPVFYALH